SEAKFDFLTERLIGGNFVTKKVRAITTQMDQPGREIYSLAIKDLFYAGVQRWGTLTERKIDFERVLGFTLVLDASIVPHTDVRDELGNVTQVPNKSLLRAAFAIDGAAHTEEFVLSEPVNANDLTVFNPPAPEIEVRTPTDHVLEDMGRTDGALVSVWSWLADTTEKQAEGNPLIMWSDRAESNEAAGRSHQDVTLGIRRKSGTATGLVIRIQDVPPEGHIPNIATVRIKGLTNISQRLDLLKGLFERANPRIHFEPEVDEFGNLVPGGYGAISRRLYVLPHSWEFFSDAYQEINEEGEIVQVIPTPVAELELLGVGWDSVIVIEPTDRMKAQAQPFQPTTKEVDLTQPEGLNQISFEYLKGQVESLYPTAPEGYQRTEGGILVPSPRSELRQPAQPKKVVSQPKRIILPSWLATTFAAGLPVTSVAPRIAQTAQLVTRAAQVAAPKLVKAAPQIAILCSLSATSCTTGLFDELGAARGGVDLDSYSQYDETRDAIILTPLPSHVAKQLAKQMALQAKQTGLQTAKHVPPSASQEIPLSDFGTEEVRLQLDGNQPSLISVPGGRKTADTEERLVLLDEEGNPVVTNTVMKTVTVNLAIDHVPNLLEGESEDSIYGGIMFLSTLFGPEGAIGALDFTTLFPDIRRALNGEITWDQIRGEIIFVADSPDSDFSEAKFDFLTERLIGGNFVTKKVRAITTQMDQPGREIYSLAIKDLFYA
ncbi:MAG: hypothetical protein HYS58_03355, partial [Elusimicrobia bacterium]|nr:hypothetical protein [Elusimicrobiota bacterium]